MRRGINGIAFTLISVCLSCRLLSAPAAAVKPRAVAAPATVNELARVVAGVYGSEGRLAVSRGHPQIKSGEGPMAALARTRLANLGFPGRSDRLHFVADCIFMVASKSAVPGVGSFSFIAWRNGDAFSALADLGGRAIAFSYEAPGHDVSALLLPPVRADLPRRPVLYWTDKGGIHVVLNPKVGRHSLWFRCGLNFSTTGRAAAIQLSLRPAPSRPPKSYIWSYDGYCVQVVPTAAQKGPGAAWWTFGPLGHHPATSRSFLTTVGFCPGARPLASHAGAIAVSVGQLGASGMPWASPPRCPVCSTLRGVDARRLAPASFKTLFMGILKGARSVSIKRGGAAVALGQRSVDKCPKAVVAFLKWAGGGALGWYRHHRGRELSDVLRSGAKLFGDGDTFTAGVSTQSHGWHLALTGGYNAQTGLSGFISLSTNRIR